MVEARRRALRRQNRAHLGIAQRPQRQRAGSASGWSAAARPADATPAGTASPAAAPPAIFSSALAAIGLQSSIAVDDGDPVTGPAARRGAAPSARAPRRPGSPCRSPAGRRAALRSTNRLGWPPGADLLVDCVRRLVAGAVEDARGPASNASVALPIPCGPCSRMAPGSRASVEVSPAAAARCHARRPARGSARAAARLRAGPARGCPRRSRRSARRRAQGNAATSTSQISCSSASSLWSAWITTQRSALLRAIARKASRSRAMPLEILLLEAVGGGRRAPSSGSRASTRRKADVGVHVEDDGEVGLVAVERQRFERVDQLVVDAAGQPLIGAGRDPEAVGNHPAARVEIGRDELVDVVEPRRREQHRLGSRPPAFRAALQDQGADRLGLGRAARLARADGGDRAPAERRDQPLDLRRLADALAALEGDEARPADGRLVAASGQPAQSSCLAASRRARG